MKTLIKKESPVTLSQLDQRLSQAFARFYSSILEPEFQSLRKEMRGIRAEIAEMKEHIEDLYKKQEDLHIEYTVIKEQLCRMEAKLDQVAGETRISNDELPRLKHQVALLQKRIEELERRAAKQ